MGPVGIIILFFLSDTVLTLFAISECDNFVTPKETAAGLTAVILFFLIAIAFIFRNKSKSVFPGKAGIFLLLWFAALLISAFISQNISYSIGEIKLPFIYLSLYFLILYYWRNHHGAKDTALMCIVATALLFSIHGLAQYFGYDFLPDHSRYILSQSKSLHVYSMFGNSNLLAGYLAVILPAAVFGLLAKNRIAIRIYYAASVLTISSAIIATGSRSAVAAAFMGVFFLTIVFFTKRTGSAKRVFSVLFSILIIFTIVLFFKSTEIPGKQGSVQLRTLYWKSTVSMFRENPFGGGPGTFRLRYFDFQKSYFKGNHSEELERLVLLEKPRHPHNEFLNMLADSGIPAVLFFVMALAAGIFESVRRYPVCEEKVAWGSMIVSFSAVAFFGFPLLVPITGFLLPLCLAAVNSEKYKEKHAAQSKRNRVLKNTIFTKSLLSAIVVSLCAFLAVKQFDPLRARMFLTGAHRSIQANDLQSAGINIDSAIKIYPDLGESHFIKGVIQMRESNYAMALDSFVRARRTSSDMNLEINISLAQRALGRNKASETTIKNVIETLPSDSRPKKILANYYLQDFEYQKALDIMKQAASPGKKDPELDDMIEKLEKFLEESK